MGSNSGALSRLSDQLGRPAADSWPVFLLVPFEVGSSPRLAGFVALLALCGLPRLHHPVFDWDRIERATDDRYFLLLGRPRSEVRANVSGLSCSASCTGDSGDVGMRPVSLCPIAAAVAGCTDQSMTRQPHYGPNDAGSGLRERSGCATAAAGTSRRRAAGRGGSANPPPVDWRRSGRGKERFEIFCAPCHGYLGDGNCRVVRRGFPRPPSYYSRT